MSFTATAHANIALAKYWGKADLAANVPAVPSLSLTLDAFRTTTTVSFDQQASHLIEMGDRVVEDERVVALLERARAFRPYEGFAHVVTENNFPTASGLASSASGFAALVTAVFGALGIEENDALRSRWARRASASAARSIYGGFVSLEGGIGADDPAAVPLHAEDHWDVSMVVALATREAKKVGSTEGMERSRKTSPLYPHWVDDSRALYQDICAGVAARDLKKVGVAMEQSTVYFHATAMTSVPPVDYWRPVTLAAKAAVQTLREDGVVAYSTMDAGPHVKVLCESSSAETVASALKQVGGIVDVTVARPGPGWSRT